MNLQKKRVETIKNYNKAFVHPCYTYLYGFCSSRAVVKMFRLRSLSTAAAIPASTAAAAAKKVQQQQLQFQQQ